MLHFPKPGTKCIPAPAVHMTRQARRQQYCLRYTAQLHVSCLKYTSLQVVCEGQGPPSDPL